MKAPKTILLVDDHRMVREALARLIEEDPRIAVAGLCGSVAEGIAFVRETVPAAAVIDFGLPDGSGDELVSFLRTHHPDCATVVLTMYKEKAVREASRIAGAAAVLLKDDAGDRLRTVLAGVLGLDRIPDDRPVLSVRENEVLALLLDGRTSKEIAVRLRISPRTVDTYRERLHQKIGSTGLAELAWKATRMRLVPAKLPEGE